MAVLPNCKPYKLTELNQIIKALSMQGTPSCPADLSTWLVTNAYGNYITAHQIRAGERQARNAQELLQDMKDLYQYLIEHPVQKDYIAVISCEAVRDVEYDTGYCSDDNAKTWANPTDAEIFIGVFSGDEDNILQQASEIAKTDPRNIILYPL